MISVEGIGPLPTFSSFNLPSSPSSLLYSTILLLVANLLANLFFGPAHVSCLLSEERQETQGDHTTYLADTRDLLLREAETRQLTVTAAPGGTRRAVLRAVAGRPGRAGRVSALHRAARRGVPSQGCGRALRTVVAGGGTQDVRAAAAAAAG